MGKQASADQKIGLALSGGGSRAIAFHLGCLHALHELGVLDKVSVLSTVSGGSVIGALYANHQGPFSEFEATVRAFLVKGLIWPSVRKMLTTSEGVKAILCWSLIVPINAAIFVASKLTWVVSFLLPSEQRSALRLDILHSPVRRFASRTTILRRVFEEEVFKGIRLRDLPPNRPLLVVNATDLRTGSAFYFSSHDSGSWRLGTLANKNVTLGQAVTASAAFPLMLPALDEYMPFNKKDGSRRVERVNLSDGGVYDNLGLAPLWPDRDPSISLNVAQVDSIICCRAGYGLRFDSAKQTVISRLNSAFACIHDRAQNAGIKRLFDLQRSGVLKNVLLPFLGQDDSRLEYPPDDLVAREDVFAYPTDFCAMSEEWIDNLSRRGYQLTYALIAEHWPDLLDDGAS